MLVLACLMFVKVVNGSTEEVVVDVPCECEISSL